MLGPECRGQNVGARMSGQSMRRIVWFGLLKPVARPEQKSSFVSYVGHGRAEQRRQPRPVGHMFGPGSLGIETTSQNGKPHSEERSWRSDLR